MAEQFLTNGAQRYRIAENRENGGVSTMVAGRKYAGRMPTLGQAAPFFLNEKRWKENEAVLQQIRPVITNTHTAVVRSTLSKALVTTANLGDYLKKESLFTPPSEAILEAVEEFKGQFLIEIFKDGAWLFPVSSEFLDSQKIRMSDSGLLFVVEKNFTVFERRSGCYVTSIADPDNDLRCGAMTTRLRTTTGEHPLLFRQTGESHKVYIWYNSKDIKISFASLGSDYYDYDERLNVVVSNRPDVLFSVLVNERN